MASSTPAGGGTLLGICISAVNGEPLVSVPEARAVEGSGLEGDRYFTSQGTFSKKKSSGIEVTLIEAETLEAVTRDYGLDVEHPLTRRNLLTRDVPLNHLVGRRFTVGEVTLEGVELCEPCGHMQRLAGKPLKKPLLHRGGLRARILRGGTLHVGDPIRLLPV